jgi:hypothetical protein
MMTPRATRWLAAVVFAVSAAGSAIAAPQAGHGATAAKPAAVKDEHGTTEAKPAAVKDGHGTPEEKPVAAKDGHGPTETKSAAVKESPAAADRSGPPSVVSVVKRIEAIKAQAAAKPATATAAQAAGRQPPAVRMLWPAKPASAGIRIAWPRALVPQVPDRDLGVRLVW